jgi:hypothetical protein
MGHEDRKIPTGFAGFADIDIVERGGALPAFVPLADLDPDDLPELMRLCHLLPLKTRHAALAAALARGADPNARCRFGAVPIDTLYTDGDGAGLALLLSHGADVSDYGWSAAHLAVITGDAVALSRCAPALLAQVDALGDTPFLLACRFGPPAIVRHLMPAKVPAIALLTAAESGALDVMAALLAAGADVNATTSDGNSALLSAIEHGQVAMVAALLEWGADVNARIDLSKPEVRHHPTLVTGLDLVMAKIVDAPRAKAPAAFTTIYSAAQNPEMIRLLVDHGADPAGFAGAAFSTAVGLDLVPPPAITRDLFAAGYRVRFGVANPERVDPLFWQAQMRNGQSAPDAKAQIVGCQTTTQGPVWSFDRKGRTATRMPGGGWLLVGGQHGTAHLPDHAIYNDVTYVSPSGAIAHYIYPAKTFAPTIDHSATCVDAGVWLIGGRGYSRDADRAPVLWLSLDDFSINWVPTHGRGPGAIYGHSARLLEGAIHISGGFDAHGRPSRAAYVLDLASRAWHRLN